MRLITTLLIGGAALMAGRAMMRRNRSDTLRLLRRYGKMAGKAMMGRRMIRRLWMA
ncbi:hypothetical protein SAMN05444392_103119 [Seinonella peptonophila]|uniref:Uncharacterized protein n=1 Tax=Seinonella peptonophila TaxID=112248 RepID=A0A1M4WAB4_9BACL|nr:hypothetical protein [Seinonella peptonophila]SHE78100.1 hypothetical protein SAMN05444392_103119 [Seinonella peptonophila]